MSLPLSESDLGLLRERVKEAETNTSGEVVIFIVPKSGAYEAVLWRAAALGMLTALVLWALLSLGVDSWGVGWLYAPTFLIVLLALGSLAGIGWVRWNESAFRLVAGQDLLAQTVRRHAQRVFLSEGVTQTEQRTGILLFVSLLERRIEVIADSGINEVVPVERWGEIVDTVRAGLKKGDVVGALADGVSACGEVLRLSGLQPSKNDRNELADDVRFGTD